jgi:hypothetical protein
MSRIIQTWAQLFEARQRDAKVAIEMAPHCLPPDFVCGDSAHVQELLFTADELTGVISRAGFLVSIGRALEAANLLRACMAEVKEHDPALYFTARCDGRDVYAACLANGAEPETAKWEAERYPSGENSRRLVTAIRRTLHAQGQWHPEA